MFIDKYKPLYAPEIEAGIDLPDTGAPPPEVEIEQPDGPGSGRSAIRKSLEKGFEDSRKAATEAEKKGSAGRQKAGRRIAGGAEIEAPEVAEETGEEGTEETPATQAPEAFSKEAKAEWANTPPNVQNAILKREQDMAKGVEELKGKYKDIDAALAPHINVLRQQNRTPAQAVEQLFSWFQALSNNPVVAFPALAKSFGWDLSQFVPSGQQQQQQPATPEQNAVEQPAGEVPPAVQKYIADMQSELGQLKQAFGGFQTSVQQQNAQKTNEIIANWSKDKPHFEKVRQMMANMIQSNTIPLKDGQVDLDAAYDAAIWASPEVRTLVQQEQATAAEQARQKKAAELTAKKQAEADKARKANVSVAGGAPGDPAAPGGKKGKGKSVRDSLREAMEQLTE